jgi:hypothetical protein
VKSDETTYPAFGRQLDERPANWLGDVDSHRIAYPARVEQARRSFTEAPFSDFEVEQTGPDRYRPIDKATGTRYRVVGFDPLQAATPQRQGVRLFTIDAGGSLLFLRREGEAAVPTEVGVVGYVREQRVA